MEEVLTGLEGAAEKASGLEDLASCLSQQSQLSESLHPSRPRPRAQVPLVSSYLCQKETNCYQQIRAFQKETMLAREIEIVTAMLAR